MVWSNQNQRLRILPGYGSVRLIHDLGNKFNIIENGNFRLRSSYNYDLITPTVGVAPDLTGFEIINNVPGSGIMIDYEKFDNDNIAVIFDSWLSGGLNYITSKKYNLKTSNLDKLKISFKYKIQKSYWKSDITKGFAPYVCAIEDRLSMDDITARGNAVRFDVDCLLLKLKGFCFPVLLLHLWRVIFWQILTGIDVQAEAVH